MAKYREFEFFVDRGTTTFGRRGTLHEFPKSDTPFAEDMGKLARRFTFNAYLFGDDYLTQMRALVDAIENSDEVGTLIHPTHGTHVVRPAECSMVYDDQKVGHEFLRLSFVLAGDSMIPSPTVNANNTVKEQIINFGFTNVDQYADQMDLDSPPDYAAKSAIDIVNKYVEAIEDAITLGDRVPQNLDQVVREINRYKDRLPSVIFDNLEFINDTYRLFRRVGNLWDNLNSGTTFVAMRRVFNTDTSFTFLPRTGTQDRLIEADNNALLNSSFRSFALGEMVLATANQTFTSSNQVIGRQEELLGFYGTEIENAGLALNEQLRRGLIDTRSAMIDDTNEKGASLPSETVIVLSDATTAYELGYELYADALRGDQVVENNNVPHPLFLPPQEELSVLTS